MSDSESDSSASSSAGGRDDFKAGHWPFGGQGEKNDVPLPKGAACLQINTILARADDNAGEFSFGGLAESMPAVPGLVVPGVGSIPVPLTENTAKTLIDVCVKSPFGRKFETLIDESVRKSWQLEANQVKIESPLWTTGLSELSKTIAERLGYEGVPIECKLYKLLVYAEGGHFTKHRDTEKEVGMIATLVIQPPSLHEGGDLIVYRNGTKQYRHDFGETDGMAGYATHYAVHYADAEHSLEPVTKGYRLALVYSICLPPNMITSSKKKYHGLSDELACSIGNIDPKTDSFALLLSHHYTKKSIGEWGVEAFKGIDRARFHALQEANESVSSDKKLCFFIAKLVQEIEYRDIFPDGGGEDEMRREDSVFWFSPSGRRFEERESVNLTLNFLNPSFDSFSCLWEPHGRQLTRGILATRRRREIPCILSAHWLRGQLSRGSKTQSN